MAMEKSPNAEKREFTDRDALAVASESEDVAKFLEKGPLLEKLVMKVYPGDFARLGQEYPSLFSAEIYQNPSNFQIYAITFIRGKESTPGHAKMKVYVEMTGRRVLKIFATN